MIRTVLAVVLAVALVATAVPVVRHGAAIAADEAVRGEIATIEAAATDLADAEELPPPGVSGPRRVLTVSFPRETATTVALEQLEIEPATDTSLATYRLEGRAARTVRIDAPIVAANGDRLELDGGGEVTLALALERGDDGRPVVVVTVPGI